MDSSVYVFLFTVEVRGQWIRTTRTEIIYEVINCKNFCFVLYEYFFFFFFSLTGTWEKVVKLNSSILSYYFRASFYELAIYLVRESKGKRTSRTVPLEGNRRVDSLVKSWTFELIKSAWDVGVCVYWKIDTSQISLGQ